MTQLFFYLSLCLFFNPLWGGLLPPATLVSDKIIQKKPLKLLHLTFDRGYAREVETIGNLLEIDVETWFIPEIPPQWLDGMSEGNALYNMGHERAARIWHLHKEYFYTFDAILTSDTAPLARIFLQNNFEKPLIVWITGHFDYTDQASLDCSFPDREFYSLFHRAHDKKNLTLITGNLYESYYAQKKGIDLGNLLIAPCAPLEDIPFLDSLIPADIYKEKTFFLPPYRNETQLLNLSTICQQLDIPTYCGSYNGPDDLKDFKGIIHIPHAWSNLTFFEAIQFGIPYFIPSKAFLKSLLKQGKSWHMDSDRLIAEGNLDLSEWYQFERKSILIYFDSWQDLAYKIATTDYCCQREKIKKYAKEHQSIMLKRWKTIFHKIASDMPYVREDND